MTQAATRPDQGDITTSPLITSRIELGELNDRIVALPLSRFRSRWWVAVGLAAALASIGGASVAWLLAFGVGVWGVNVPVAWGFAIVNFVWWIGIGHAGTLISAILLLLRQPWRNSINRFAEAMTLFAVANAGLFPLLHLGRIWKFYYLLPYPNQMGVWPQWRSPLVWDAFAVSTYALVSLLFWYLGLIPDLGAFRDATRSRLLRRVVGFLALGWRGETTQWQALQRGYLILAGLATALVISVHSIVSLDFAVGIVPGWNATIFPPFFVAGAIFSGFAMVLTITIPLRALLRLKDIVTTRHLDLMAKVMLATGLIVAYGYLTESLAEAFSTEPAELYRLQARLVGHGAVTFWTTVLCNVVIAQLLWFKRVRTRPIPLLLVSLVVNVGMWLERYDIVVTSLERDYLPSAWRPYMPTLLDWGLFIGTIGLFTLLFLLFIRLLPICPVYEVKELAHEHGEIAPPTKRAQRSWSIAPGRRFIAEFDEPGAFISAAQSLCANGCRDLRTFSPMPLHGLRDVSRKPPRWLPAAFLIGGVSGGMLGYAMQYISAVHDYPWIVGSKPLHSWPSFIPIVYEMTILGASLCGFVATLRACGLPRLHHPDFELPGFTRVLRDRFFLIAVAPHHASISKILSDARPVNVSPLDQEET